MILQVAALLGLLVSPSLGLIGKCSQPASDRTSIYDFTLPNIFKTGSINFADLRGKVVLVVNVATYCDHTPQFLGLNALQKEFGADLQIIGVPTDQFHYVSILCMYLVQTPNREIISTYFLFVYIRFEKKISSINFIFRDKLQIYIALQFLSSWWWCFGGVPGEGVLFFLSFLLYFFGGSIELSSLKRKKISLFAILFRQRLIFPS